MKIYWRAFILSSTEKKAQDCALKITNLIPLATLMKLERYWKNDKQFEMEFYQEIEEEGPEGILKALKSAAVLSYSWQLNIGDLEDNPVDLSGVASSDLKYSFLEWASFRTLE